MAEIKGLINAKGKSGEIIANNGAYFVDLTNATESSGVYTIPSADIENGDFTLQVGDTLIDKDSGSMLKVATLTPDITASLVFEASIGGGGKQLYQHNIFGEWVSGSYKVRTTFTILNDNNNTIDNTTLKTYLTDNGFNSSTKVLLASGELYMGGSYKMCGIYINGTSIYLCASGTGNEQTLNIVSFNTITDTIITL